MKEQTRKKFAAVLLALLLILSGCTARSDSRRTPEPAKAAAALAQPLLEAEPETVCYPLETDLTLTALAPAQYDGEDGSAPFFQALEKAVGVKVRYTLLPGEEYVYQDGLVHFIANDLPDLIWGLNPYMLENLEDELLELDEYLTTSAPNYLRAITGDKDSLAASLPEEGPILQFAALWEDPRSDLTLGPVIRQDLLDRYGLPRPETYGDWEEFLRAAREDVSQPLNLAYTALAGANYLSAGKGVSMGFTSEDRGFYQVDGQVKYGPLEPGYTEVVTMLAGWYQEGLIGHKFRDFPDISSSDYLLKQAMGESAIFFLPFDKLEALEVTTELPDLAISLLPDPVEETGQETHLAQSRPSPVREPGFSISAVCKDPEAAVRFVDYLYSPEGTALCSQGASGGDGAEAVGSGGGY